MKLLLTKKQNRWFLVFSFGFGLVFGGGNGGRPLLKRRVYQSDVSVRGIQTSRVSSSRPLRTDVLLGLRVGLGGFRRGSICRVPRLQPCLVASLVVVHEQAALALVAAAAHEVAAGKS